MTGREGAGKQMILRASQWKNENSERKKKNKRGIFKASGYTYKNTVCSAFYKDSVLEFLRTGSAIKGMP